MKYRVEDAETTENTLFEVARRLNIERFTHDEYIFRQDEEGDKFYIVLSGVVIGISESNKVYQEGFGVLKMDKEVIRITEGFSFGEMALISGASRSLSMKAYNDTILISLKKSDFLRCFGVFSILTKGQNI